MIIMNQDKEYILNLNNITSIGVDGNNEIKCIFNNGKWSSLGQYKTKERAKEVLQEIISRYQGANFISFSNNIGYVKNEAYKMPEE